MVFPQSRFHHFRASSFAMRFFQSVAALAALTFGFGAELARTQLNTTVGPTTSLSSKQTKICSVLDYGGAVGSADIGPAILSAFNVSSRRYSHISNTSLTLLYFEQNCVLKNSGSTLYIPSGNYNMQTWVTLNKGTKWALRLDGFITRTGKARY
jgi:rhamnogalacturonan hydrolase